MWRRMGWRVVAAAVLAAAVVSMQGAYAQKTGEWSHYSADNGATKYSPLDQIDKSNVARLRVAWRRPQVDPALLEANPGLPLANRFTATPIMADGVLYTPPSVRGDGPGETKGTLQLPGSNGGAARTGAAFDPETGMLYIPSKMNPFAADLVPGNAQDTNLRYRAGTRSLIAGPRGLPLVKPPYGRVTAINLNTGDHVWMVANGDGPRHHAELEALKLAPLGQAVRSAAIVTRTLLFVTEGDQIHPRTPPNGGGRMFRALDKATGKTLWEMELEAGATGAPMTYAFNGKQFVVLAIGGARYPAELVALSLP